MTQRRQRLAPSRQRIRTASWLRYWQVPFDQSQTLHRRKYDFRKQEYHGTGTKGRERPVWRAVEQKRGPLKAGSRHYRGGELPPAGALPPLPGNDEL
jgi:hypothetical protein